MVAALRKGVVRARAGTRKAWQAPEAAEDLEERLPGSPARGEPKS